MAMRGAVTACLGRNRISSSSLLRFHIIKTRFHHSLNNSRLTSFPLSKTGYKYPIRAIHEATILDPSTPKKGDEAKKKWEVKMLYDGDCPLCLREVDMLRERNKRYGTIEFVDISSDKYSPEENHGLDYETAMGRIHAVMADGTIVTDVEAFRKLYEAVGLGWVYAITKYKPIGAVADAVYSFWAKYRLQVTGRPPMEEILEARKKSKGEVCNDKNTCKM